MFGFNYTGQRKTDMSIKKDLKARGLYINKRKRAQMLAVSLVVTVVAVITIVLSITV